MVNKHFKGFPIVLVVDLSRESARNNWKLLWSILSNTLCATIHLFQTQSKLVPMLPQLSYIIHNHHNSSKKQVEEGNFSSPRLYQHMHFRITHEENLRNLPFLGDGDEEIWGWRWRGTRKSLEWWWKREERLDLVKKNGLGEVGRSGFERKWEKMG